MAQPKVVVRQREALWWMEEGEEDPQTYATRIQETTEIPVKDRGLREKYDTGRFQPGWSGKDAPAVEKMGSGYASAGDRNFDNLGSTSGKKTSRGSVGTVTVDDIKEAQRILAIAAKQKINEEFIDDEFDGGEMSPEENGAGPDDMDGFTGENDNDAFSDEGLAGEDDVPPEMTDEGFEGSDEIADDVTVEIGGQRFTLEPEAPEGEFGDDEFGAEGGDEFSGDIGDEMGGDEFGGPEEMGGPEEGGMGDDEELLGKGGVKAERKDVSEKGKRVRETNYDRILDEAIQNARQGGKGKKITKEELTKKLIAHHLRIKGMLEKNHKVAIKALKELFTGEYVLNKQGEPGYDFSPVGGDESFAVVARAASGDQYSPTISKSVWEPDKKGGKTAHAKTVTQEGKDFQAWLAKMQKNLVESESDPGEDSANFNKNDVLDKNLSSTGGLADFPALPELIGKDDEVISQYSEARERVNARRKAEAEKARKQESEQPIRFPSKEVKEDLEKNLTESAKFNFKDLMAGRYQG